MKANASTIAQKNIQFLIMRASEMGDAIKISEDDESVD